jgi:hypothetical protein
VGVGVGIVRGGVGDGVGDGVWRRQRLGGCSKTGAGLFAVGIGVGDFCGDVGEECIGVSVP